MKPEILAKKYDKIAAWWMNHHRASDYGLAALSKAIRFAEKKKNALDVGCGSGGRMISLLVQSGFDVTGVDVSSEMIKLAKEQHPHSHFFHSDFCIWETSDQYDLVLAWDSIFHLPIDQQTPVVMKMCKLLKPGGVLLYTFGNDIGEHQTQWLDDVFHYSSIGIEANLAMLSKHNCECWHLELDQYPEKHVVAIAKKKH